MPMLCRVEAVGAPAGAVAAPAVSRRVDEDLAARGGVAGPDPLRPDRRDEIDELAYCGGREVFVEPKSWPRRERKGPAGVCAGDELGAGVDLRDECVETSDEVGGGGCVRTWSSRRRRARQRWRSCRLLRASMPCSPRNRRSASASGRRSGWARYGSSVLTRSIARVPVSRKRRMSSHTKRLDRLTAYSASDNVSI